MTFHGVFRTVGPTTQRVHRGDWIFSIQVQGKRIGVFPAPLSKGLTHPLIGVAANDARRGHQVVALVQGSAPGIAPGFVGRDEPVQPIDATGIVFHWEGAEDG